MPRPSNLTEARSSSLTQLLLRPFIDLEPGQRGPLCARGVEQYWAAFADGNRPRFVLQRILPRSFRIQLLNEANRQEYLIEDPRDLCAKARSPRWNSVCDALNDWESLTIDQQCRLVLVLQTLCFYSLISNQIPDISDAAIADHSEYAELAYRRAVARYVLGLSGAVAAYGHADLSELVRVATTAPPVASVALNAALMIFVHKAKIGAPLIELTDWRERAARIAEAVTAKSDVFTRSLLLSRFYRAVALVPQRLGDRPEVVRTMDLAEQHALAMTSTNESQELLRLENLYPVIESRIKEALWLGDDDLALARAQALVDLDPYDSRAWIELGHVRLRRNECAHAAEAFTAAAILGAPATAIGHHMAGCCFRDLGQPLLAAHFFKASVEADLHAISPHDEIQRLPNLPVLTPLKEWSMHSFEA